MGLIFHLPIIVRIVVQAVWAVKRFTGNAVNGNQTLANQTQREILQARYARSELTRH